MTANESLEPLTPSTAIEMYLKERSGEVTDRTLQAHDYRLRHFRRWCKQEGIENMNDLTGRRLHEFRLWRREDGDLEPVSLRTQLQTLRVFLKFCGAINGVSDDLHDKLQLPMLRSGDNQSEDILPAERAGSILDYLRQYEFASRQHVILELLWHTGVRLGALSGLDVDDYHASEEYLDLRHRPDTGTPLKNGQEGERPVALDPDVAAVLDGWLEHKRPAVTDEHGREPLIATEHGRMSQSAIRETVYSVTRPCYAGGECPHDRDPNDCEATSYGSRSKCPSSRSPHAIRRGSITHYLTADVPERVVSDRMNVGLEVLEKHYDKREPEQKMEQRRDYLENV